MAIPVRFSRTPGSIERLAPGLDEHRAEILAEL
jgi:crotonobetainyl-CoA:carnitine CoA-transferase CaiB-like acyl-CoA transferase